MPRKMKDSGIEWIGEIPEDWKVVSLSAIASIKTGSTPNNKLLNDFGNIDWVKTNNLLEEIGTSPSDQKLDESNIKDITIASKGSTLVACIGDIGKMAYLYEDVSYNQQINAITFNSYINDKFGFYALFAQKEQHKSLSNGNVLQILNSQKQGLVKIVYPSIEKQAIISNFLDEKCNGIDNIKNTINQEIQTLKDYKKSLITEAVTKGLDKDAEMKDSGIEWIGQIPKHWKAIKLKHASILKGRIGWQGLTSDEYMYDEGLPYLVTGTDFKNGYVDWNNCARVSESRYEMDRAIQIKESDLLITKDGTIGKLAISKNCPEKATLNSGVFLIRNNGKYKYIDKYIYYLLQSEQFYLWFELNDTGNSTIRHLYQKDFYNFKFTYPSTNEQQEIVNYLDTKCKIINDAISSKQHQLEILEDYKKSLIYEYVTGKKEVPDAEI